MQLATLLTESPCSGGDIFQILDRLFTPNSGENGTKIWVKRCVYFEVFAKSKKKNTEQFAQNMMC